MPRSMRLGGLGAFGEIDGGEHEILYRRTWLARSSKYARHSRRGPKLSLVSAIQRQYERLHELRFRQLRPMHGDGQWHRRILHSE